MTMEATGGQADIFGLRWQGLATQELPPQVEEEVLGRHPGAVMAVKVLDGDRHHTRLIAPGTVLVLGPPPEDDRHATFLVVRGRCVFLARRTYWCRSRDGEPLAWWVLPGEQPRRVRDSDVTFEVLDPGVGGNEW